MLRMAQLIADRVVRKAMEEDSRIMEAFIEFKTNGVAYVSYTPNESFIGGIYRVDSASKLKD